MKSWPLLLLVALGLALGGCASTGEKAQAPDQGEKLKTVRPSRAEIEARVVQELALLGETDIFKEGIGVGPDGSASYDIPITVNQQVEQFIDYFQNKIPKRFTIYLSRSTRYMPMMRGILKDYGLPEDLIYMALIESGFSCTATSTAAAVGPWQFIRASGTRFGLKIDAWVDERQDPVKSTHAAARYLRELYAEFGSWYLAAAAYNAGENKIRRALSRYQASDYWTISHHQRSYLANETKEYVPKMIAAALIAKDPQKYGFVDVPYEPPLAYDEVTVHPGISMNALAKATNLSPGELAALNPELVRGATPPFGGSYTLRVPLGAGRQFETLYAQLNPGDLKARLTPVTVAASKGDTLASMAKHYGVRLAELQALNPRAGSRQLKAGQRIVVPGGMLAEEARGQSVVAKVAARQYTASPVKAKEPVVYAAPHREQRKITHTVAKGDTIWDIAQTYNVDPKDIQQANGNKNGKLALGQKLVIYAAHTKVEAKVEPRVKPQAVAAERKDLIYKVQKGDTLWNISRRFNVSPEDIKRWNKLSGSGLTPGDTLTVRR